MRLLEIISLVLLLFYHVSLLFPRSKRNYYLNFIIFFAALSAVASLGFEGLRWTSIPAVLLIVADLLVLIFTFKTLHGHLLKKKILTIIGHFFRFIIAFVGFVGALVSLLLAFCFPLPSVPLSGNYSVALRILDLPQKNGQSLYIWYPASGSMQPGVRPLQTPEVWQNLESRGGLPEVFYSHMSLLPVQDPVQFIKGGKLASGTTQFPVVISFVPSNREAWEYETLWEDLASQGYVVAAVCHTLKSQNQNDNFWNLLVQSIKFTPVDLVKIEVPEKSKPVDVDSITEIDQVVRTLSLTPGDLLFKGLEANKTGLICVGRNLLPGSDLSKITCLVSVGVKAERVSNLPQLWTPYSFQKDPIKSKKNTWVLKIEGFLPGDLPDSTFFQPYLVFTGLKSRLDSQSHLLFRSYLGVYLRTALGQQKWETLEQDSYAKTEGALLITPGR